METVDIDKKTSYVNFMIGTEHFAISVYRVLEIIQFEHLTQVPNTSRFVKGVLNFRGSIAPVIDMEKRFNGNPNQGKEKMVIIVEVKNKDANVLMGLEVDEVCDVVEFSYKDIHSVPDLGIKYCPEFLEGMVNYEDDFIMVLNVDRVLNVDELSEIRELTKATV